MSDNVNRSQEKTRLCPSCRMAISVLATKCRFCGEAVGRPKDESRQLSIEDMGGETIVNYAPSSNVMEALEAFRTEEVSGTTPVPQPKRRSLFARKAETQAVPAGPTASLPELDERSKALASLAVPVRQRPTTTRRYDEPSWMKKMAWLGAFIAGLIILYFGSVKGWAIIQRWNAEPVQTTSFVNRAPALEAQGRPALEIHAAAIEALQEDESPENREIAQRARKKVADEVRAILNRPSITLHELREAANLAALAVQRDKAPVLLELQAEANQETMDYGIHLVSTNTKVQPREAVVKLYSGELVTVRPNDVIKGRFKVQTVAEKYVRLYDTKRQTGTSSFRAVQVDQEGVPR